VAVRYQSDLPRIAAALEQNASRVTRNSAERVANAMRLRAPVDTGQLKASIQVKQRSGAASARVTAAYYWVFQEYGTRHHAAQPFVNQSVETERPVFRRQAREMFR
jgi:HK97 gp10 family phage protein